jgi:hypothetical protein
MKLNEILDNIKDMEFFKKQLYRALKVPDEFIGKDEQPQTIPLENIK